MTWWNELTQLQKIFASIAIPTTVIMVIQFVLQLFGFASEDGSDGIDTTDVDTVSDFQEASSEGILEGQPDGIFDESTFDEESINAEEGHSGMRLFTLRGIIAFFAVGGWMGVAAIDWNLSALLAIVLAIVAGSLAMYFVAWTIFTFLRMQQSGNIKYENAVGKEGEVYLSIPPNGRGKVNVIVQDRLCEIDAVTKSDRTIKTGEKIIVVDITEDGILLVEPKNSINKNEIIKKM